MIFRKLIRSFKSLAVKRYLPWDKSAGGGGAPAGAQYVTLATDSTLTNERVLTQTATQVTVTDAGAGSTVTLDVGSNVPLLGGRASGQTLNGGTAASENLTLVSTAHATKGQVRLGSTMAVKSAGEIIPYGVGNGSEVGNARGTGSIELQTSRTTAAQVASAQNCFIGGGYNNRLDDHEGVISGGITNSILLGANSTIGGGASNSINAGVRNTIAGGHSNSISGTATRGTIGGGESNNVAANYSTIPGGLQAKTNVHGQVACASGQFGAAGDAQTTLAYTLRNTTTDGTQTELFLDGSSLRLTVQANSSISFSALIVGRTQGASPQTGGYEIVGVIERDGSNNTVMIAAVTKRVLGEDTAAWDATIEADDTNEALAVKVTGAAATTIRWVATIRTAEVTFA